jgi:UDP-N-acetylenolpyruvoylglucosamine reductase
VNLGEAKAADIKKLISSIKETVKEKFGVDLKEEIQIL